MILLDNSALTSFAHLGLIPLLRTLFGDVAISDAVYHEGIIRAKESERTDRIKRAVEEKAIKVISPTREERTNELSFVLGAGESQTIAIGINRGFLVVIDDAKARKIARKEGADIIGSLGVLRLGFITCPIKTKDELKEFVRILGGVLYFTEDLGRWVLEAEKGSSE